MSRQRVVIIGGGLAGLAVALRRASSADALTLLESSPRLGGQLQSHRADGFVVEHGAEGFVARSSAVPALAEAAGVGSALVDQRVTTSFGFAKGALQALAPGEAARFLGFQVSGDELGRGIRSFALGMGQLTDALSRSLIGRVELSTSTEVTSLEQADSGWQVRFGDKRLDADQVVLATRADTAARLLAKPLGVVGEQLGLAPTLSSATVSLAFARASVDHSLEGTGFVVATADQREGCRACTFASSKFEGRAPDGIALLRLFFRPSTADFALDDAEWTARAVRQLSRVLRLRGGPVRSWVSRWRHALPVFDDAHRGRVAAVEQALQGRGLFLAGSAFHGAGIDAAVCSAERVAAALG
jgi:oxygen-dependent protoporphyrinogen oxidase